MVFYAAVLLLSCQAAPEADGIRLVTWNLENFFDVYDDPYRKDEETRPYYPSEARRERLAKVLRQIDADVVCLQEIENRFVLEEFNRQQLAGLGYQVVLVEGNDERGIDVALLSRLPIAAVTSHRYLRFPDAAGREQRFQRDLLLVELGDPWNADVYVVHLKSQAGGDDADRVRLAEAQAAAEVLGRKLRRNAGYRAVLAGDCNDLPDSPTLKAFLDLGLVDSCAKLPQVTYNQEPHRSRIDYLLFTPALAGTVQKARIVEGEEVSAASDHNPVVVELAVGG